MVTMERAVVGVLFGAVDAIMVVPITISFTAIIFRHEVFMQLLPSLVKITLFSSAVHQIAFTWNSGLNFAVGQVQDAGLIFLSSMAANIAEFMLDSGNHNTKAIVSTALFVLSLYTALMGLVLIVIGRLRLASVIQYLPMPGIIFPSFYCCHEQLYTG
jgi:SulP family sulfate permease